MDTVKMRFSDLMRQLKIMEAALHKSVSEQVAFWATQRPVLSVELVAWDGDIRLPEDTVAGMYCLSASEGALSDAEVPDQLVGLVTSRHPAVRVLSPIVDAVSWRDDVWVNLAEPLAKGTVIAHVHWVPTVHLIEATKPEEDTSS